MNDDLIKLISVIRNSGVLLYQLGRQWGIVCNALDTEAIKKVEELKSGIATNEYILLLDSFYRVSRYVEKVDQSLWKYAKTDSKSEFTFIHEHAINLPDSILGNEASVAIRITDDDCLKNLIVKCGSPLLFTHAGKAGKKEPRFYNDIDFSIITNVDFIVENKNLDLKKLMTPKTVNLIEKQVHAIAG